jgi:hypothetical protein
MPWTERRAELGMMDCGARLEAEKGHRNRAASSVDACAEQPQWPVTVGADFVGAPRID